MRTNTKKLLAIALVIVMMASAGCAGWGTDGPTNDNEPNQSDDSNASDDLEETQNDTNASEGDSSNGSDTSTSSGGDDSTESDDAPDNSGDSSDGTPSDQSDDDSGAEDSGSSGDSNSEPQSSTGADGSDGSDGDDSSDGSDGSNGNDGSDDSDGSNGSDGTDDDDGDSGDGDEQLTCDAFDTQPEAQMYYDEAPEERDHLDANNDDIPCESLPDGDSSGGDDGNDTDVGPATHELKVTVTNHNGDPVEGASVSIVTYDGGEDVASGTTNSDGVATFDVPNGSYEAVVTTEDDELLQPSDQRLVDVNGEDASLDVQMQSSGDNGGGEETHTLTVYADSAVTLESTDEDGMNETKEPTDGVVTFEVPAGGYTLAADGYHRADVLSVEEDTEITLQDTSGATMDVVVVDAETGNPIGGAEMDGECALWYTGGDSYIETTSASEGDGIVTVHTGVTPTTCEPTVTAPGYESTTIGLDAPGDDGQTVELEPTNPDVPEPNETGNEPAVASHVQIGGGSILGV